LDPAPLEVAGESGAVAELAAAAAKADALVIAWRALGVIGVPGTGDVVPAMEWLAARGVVVDRSRAYAVRRKLAAGRGGVGAGPSVARGGAR
jgi:hypothetical protein